MCKCLISNGAVVTSNYLNGDCILNLILDLKKEEEDVMVLSVEEIQNCVILC